MDAPRPELLVAAARPKQPYPGLRPFEPEEWSIFFGRESMIDDVIERLALHRVVLIHGASGSGKSSLVRAGVLPKLARQHLRHGVNWLTCTMRPSGGPLWNLAREFARLEGRADDLDRIRHIIRLFNRRGATLHSAVGSLHGLAGKRLCILVDQFEELFRFERETSREEAELFVELLIGQISHDDANAPERDDASDAGTNGADMHVAITMRSEFLGECARFNGFAEAVNRTQYLVPRMAHETLVRAIRRPAQIYGGEVTLELAERLVADVRGREDELPLIQHGLMLMWNNAQAAQPNEPVTLDVKQFEHSGGLTKLLSNHADRVMAAAKPFEGSANASERLFRALTDINAEGRAIRHPLSFRELVALCGIPAKDLRAILDVFRADGVSFLTPYFPAAIEDKTIIDISHEALIRCWGLIADPQFGWLRQEFQDGLVWRSLLIDAKAFQMNRKHVLSPVATDQRTKWLTQRSAAWSERYGGGWNLVDNFLQRVRTATRSKRIQRLFVLPVIWLAFTASVFLAKAYIFLDLQHELTVGLSFFLVAGVMAIVLAQMVLDYSRRFVVYERIRPFLVLTAFVTFFGAVICQAFDASEPVQLVFNALFVGMMGVTAIRIAFSIGRFVRRYSSPFVRHLTRGAAPPELQIGGEPVGLSLVPSRIADAGIYDYICGLHPAMKGKVEVK